MLSELGDTMAHNSDGPNMTIIANSSESLGGLSLAE